MTRQQKAPSRKATRETQSRKALRGLGARQREAIEFLSKPPMDRCIIYQGIEKALPAVRGGPQRIKRHIVKCIGSSHVRAKGGV